MSVTTSLETTKTRLYFDASADLTNACRWVYNPEKLVEGSAHLYVLLQQANENYCALLAKGPNDVWFYRICPSQGPIGTTLLLDAQEWLSRVGKKKVWGRRNICLTTTKQYKVSVESIAGADGNNLQTSGNITIPLYPGDLGDFTLPEDTEWETVVTIVDGWTFRTLCRAVDQYAGLKSDKTNKAVYFRIVDGRLSFHASERGGNRGHSLVSAEIDCIGSNRRFGVEGKHISKFSDVFSSESSIEIQVDNLEEPTHVRFIGDAGWISMPIVDEYMISELSQGAMCLFFGEKGFVTEDMVSRVYPLVDLADNCEMQEPKDDERTKDLVFEEIESNLVISKLGDPNRVEVSSTPAWSLQEEGNWRKVSVSYLFVADCLKALDKYVTYAMKQEEISYEETGFDDIEEEDWVINNDSPQVKLTQLTLKRAITMAGAERWFVFIEHPEFKDLKLIVNCGLPETLTDLQDND